MSLSTRSLVPLAVETLRDPQDVFGRLSRLGLPRSTLWECLLLVVLLSVILAEGSNLLIASTEGAGIPALFAQPLVYGALQLGLLAGTVALIHGVGRKMGGQGTLDDAILAVVWLQFVMVCLQVVQSVAILVMPPVALLIGLAGLVVFFWLLTSFIAALHGFASLGRVFGMILFVMVGVALVLSAVLTFMGVTVPRV